MIYDITAKDLIKSARSRIGIKFKHRGRNNYGLDCGGLLVVCFKDYNIYIKDILKYSREPIEEFEDTLTENFDKPIFDKRLTNRKLRVEDLKIGDLAILHFDDRRYIPRHICIVANHPLENKLTLIHTDSKISKVSEHIINNKFLDDIVLVYRPKYREE